jgi:hypothetical protein
MNRSILGIIACLIALTLAWNASASLSQITGHWLNADPNTRGVTTVDITASGTNVNVHAWGKCHPTDCDWGNANKAYAYAPAVSSDLIKEATAITAIWNKGFKDTIMVIRPLDGLLQVDTFSVFAPGDGRTSYASRYIFYRAKTTPVLLVPSKNVISKMAPMTAPLTNTTPNMESLEDQITP